MEQSDYTKLQAEFILRLNAILAAQATYNSLSDQHLQSIQNLVVWLHEKNYTRQFLLWFIGAYCAVATEGMDSKAILDAVHQSDMEQLSKLDQADG